jgi:ribosomal protein L11 methyltransferase
MLNRTKWRVVEEACGRAEAAERWSSAQARGALGGVTSWGAGMGGREMIRLYWEVGAGPVPEGEDLVEENWTSHWRESFQATPVTAALCLVPAWEPPNEGEARCNLRIDPGMAFGAGDHPTTRLCLRLLEDRCAAGPLPGRFLDVGCGTGVLALAAGCLGVERSDALDIDPFGYAACRRNAALNGLQHKIRPLLLSLDLLPEHYPLAAANIVIGQLETLAPLLRQRVEPGGALLLSGFETTHEPRVLRALGWPVGERLEEENWVAMILHAPGEAT